MKPFCFVLLPFGTKTEESGRVIDFDRVYAELIQPAILAADLEPIRSDQDYTGIIIPKAMFERMMLCDYAIADVSTAGPNVLYDLGVRQGMRPHSTVMVAGGGMRLPVGGVLYALNALGVPQALENNRKILVEKLIACRAPAVRPLFQIAGAQQSPEIARLKTDLFREVSAYSPEHKEKLRLARGAGAAALAMVHREIDIPEADPAIVVDLFLSYRAVKDWQAMVNLVPRMSPVLARTVLVREQLGFALNRLGRHDDAERVLQEVITQYGPNSETSGLLGRVQKDRWEEAVKAGQDSIAGVYLRKAIETYLAGFEADWRDAYPGINAVTLMEMEDPVDPRQSALLPVVRYAVQRRIAGRQPDYWDHAAVLELSILAGDRAGVDQALRDALAAIRERWEPESTARNLKLIQRAREKRNVDAAWIGRVISELEHAA